MNKPDDIPQDVWDSAERGMEYLARRQELIARAIMAEREACAVVALCWQDVSFSDTAEQIAAAIRKRGKSPLDELVKQAQELGMGY